MNLFTQKRTPVVLGILLVTLLIVAGCTTVAALSFDEEGQQVSAEFEVSMPLTAWGPSYYRDDPALIEGVASLVSVDEQRFSPSYWRDDLSVIEGVVEPVVMSEQRFSPSYWRDDPSLIEGVSNPNVNVERRWGPSYWRDDPALVNGVEARND